MVAWADARDITCSKEGTLPRRITRQIYTRWIIPSYNKDSMGNLTSNLGPAVRITEPPDTRNARAPSITWNETRNHFGLAWLETRSEGGISKQCIYFNELFPGFADPFKPGVIIKTLPKNQKVKPDLVEPSSPCIASNDVLYAVAYQDRRSPFDTQNIYLNSIDPLSNIDQ